MRRTFVYLLFVLLAVSVFSQNFRFAVFGDNRPFNNEDSQPYVFKEIVQNIELIHPAFVVGMGDFVYGYGANAKRTKEEYMDFLKVITSFTMPFYPVVGNHEVAGVGGQEDYINILKKPLYYSFDYEKSHFVVLDTNVNFPNGVFTQKQFDWLKEDLRHAASAQNVFFFMHKPIYEYGDKTAWPDKKMAREVRKLIEKFNDEHHNVRVIFQGHEHRYWEKKVNGIDYIITGGGGAPLDAEPQNGGFYHFLLVSVNGTHVKTDVFLPGCLSVKYVYSSENTSVATAVIENRLPSIYNGLTVKGLKFIMPKTNSYEIKGEIPCKIWNVTPFDSEKVIVWVEANLEFRNLSIKSLLKAALAFFERKNLENVTRSTHYKVIVEALKKP